MSDGNNSLESRVKTLATAWSTALAAGSLALYAAGYLAQRFRLRALGIEPELEIVDERYLFTGAHFFIYLLTLVPMALVFLLPLALVVAVARRWRPPRARIDGTGRAAARALWQAPPGRLGLFGVVWAVAAVQLVMRRVFYLEDLLLEPLPCDPFWFERLARDETGVAEPLLLAGLVLLTLPTLLCLARAGRRRAWAAPLAALALVQLLLLPVHFGVLAAGGAVDRLAALPGEEPASKVWRIFATGAESTFLVERPGSPAVRRLVIVPAKKLERLEVTRRERLFAVLAAREGNTCGR